MVKLMRVHRSVVRQAVYTALKETESRSTDLLPLWKVPLVRNFVPRLQKAEAAVDLIRKTTTELIDKCKAMVDAEEQVRSLSYLACRAAMAPGALACSLVVDRRGSHAARCDL